MRQRFPTFLLPLVLGAVSACNAPMSVRIAVVGSSADHRNGAELAASHVNRAGGIRGRTVEIVFADDSGDTRTAAIVAQRMLQDQGVVAVVGHGTASKTFLAAGVYAAATDPVPLISVVPGTEGISNIGERVFRLTPGVDDVGRTAAEYARRTLNATRAAVVYRNDHVGRRIAGAFEARFTDLGGLIMKVDVYLPQIPEVRQFVVPSAPQPRADIVLVAGDAGTVREVRRQLETVAPNTHLVATGEVVTKPSDLLGLANVLAVTQFDPDRTDEVTSAFTSAYRARFSDQSPGVLAAGAYDAVMLLADAVSRVGPDRRRIGAHLRSVGHGTPAYDGVLGRIAFDDSGERTSSDPDVVTIQAGRFVPPDIQ